MKKIIASFLAILLSASIFTVTTHAKETLQQEMQEIDKILTKVKQKMEQKYQAKLTEVNQNYQTIRTQVANIKDTDFATKGSRDKMTTLIKQYDQSVDAANALFYTYQSDFERNLRDDGITDAQFWKGYSTEMNKIKNKRSDLYQAQKDLIEVLNDTIDAVEETDGEFEIKDNTLTFNDKENQKEFQELRDEAKELNQEYEERIEDFNKFISKKQQANK